MARVKTVVVGDIHGCLEEFKGLLDLCAYNKETDRLILAGDIVDRGPDSAGCIQLAIDSNAEFVIGNHDDKYIRYAKHEEKKTHVGRKHYVNPIKFNEERTEIWNSLSEEMIQYLMNGKYCLPLWEYNALVVHAGVRPGPNPDYRDREEYIYTRYIHKDDHRLLNLPGDFSRPPNSVHWTEVYDGTVDIIYGHDVQSLNEPVIRINDKGARTIGIDTGSCFGGCLTAMILTPENPTGDFISVKAKKTWKEFRIVR